VLQAAAAHEHYGVLHFPHNLDFRGRAYPMSPHLSHMGNDLCRGLLTFADARPLGQDGFRWLLIHLANLFGEVDKRSFDDRIEWALHRLPDIIDSAEAPLGGQRWWLQGEAPWSVLAACLEIAAAVAHGDVSTYESRLPVHQDGSCNGLQHYAAMGRDVAGAQAVCLVDAPAPDDVYSKVMMQVRSACSHPFLRSLTRRLAAVAATASPHSAGAGVLTPQWCGDRRCYHPASRSTTWSQRLCR